MIKPINKKYFLMAVSGSRIGKNTDMDIAVRCPVCGDSSKKKTSTRLHLYTKDGVDQDFVHCFNGDCQVHNKSMYSFLRDFFPSLIDLYKKETFAQNIHTLSGDDVFSSLQKSKPVQQDQQDTKIVQTHDLSQYMKDVTTVPEALEYISNRGITYDESNFGKWYFGHQDLQIGDTLYKITNSIIIPLYYNGEKYGFYSRNIHNKVFCTYMPDSNTGYKIWNYFNISKDEPVYIYEGIFDCISGGLKNSVALMGATLPEQRLKELKNPVFVLDNDKTGNLNAIAYAQKGYSVYVQPDKYKEKDMNELMLNNKNTNISNIITSNIYSGISGVVRLKSKL